MHRETMCQWQGKGQILTTTVWRCKTLIRDTSLSCWNIGGLVQHLSEPDWIRYVQKLYFIILVETFVDTSLDLSHVFSDHVQFLSPAVKLSHHGRRSGGVTVLVRKNLKQFV